MLHKIKTGILPLLLLFMLSFSLVTEAKERELPPLSEKQLLAIESEVKELIIGRAAIPQRVVIDSLFHHSNRLILYFNQALAYYPFKEEEIEPLFSAVKRVLPKELASCKVTIVSNGSALEELILPSSPFGVNRKEEKALVTPLSRAFLPDRGLENRYLALWNSHGYYYNQNKKRWQWQRARLFETIEDLYSGSYVVDFLTPMLENAGATVFLPRERDYSSFELICDNDSNDGNYIEVSGKERWQNSPKAGFANEKKSYLTGENPFKMGSSRVVSTIKRGKESSATWKIEVAKSGYYSLYISYHSFEESSEEAHYTLLHGGGESHFAVNQRMGGGTWIHLGRFYFKEGEKGYTLKLSNRGDKRGLVVSADAIKVGGGVGNIARSDGSYPPHSSNYPRFSEGARYWLQWAGFDHSLYSPTEDKDDYVDDYSCRGRWVNALSGGSSQNPKEEGLSIPIDLSLAFHTDAGVTLNDSIIGTLAIHTRYSEGSDLYPTGANRIEGRYLADFIQSQIVDDIRALYNPKWQRRGLWDRSYAESRMPVVPSLLLELLSHQNFADMRFGLDPQFKFDVSRAIYKGIVNYFSVKSGKELLVAPLPVKNLALELKGESALVSWCGVEDPLTPSASPDRYILYSKVDNGGFDNGVLVKGESVEVEIERGKIYSFKVTAANGGGESFPSEELSLYSAENPKGEVLIINGFTKVAPPYSFNSTDTLFAGFYSQQKSSIPYHYDPSFVGQQYNYIRKLPWEDDDAPGFGASHGDYEKKVIIGNTFNYTHLHGKAFANNGYSFTSISKGAAEALNGGSEKYKIVDLILGKEGGVINRIDSNRVDYSILTEGLVEELSHYLSTGGNLLISGSNVASDLWRGVVSDTTLQQFAKEKLGYNYRSGNGSRRGDVVAAPNSFGFTTDISYHYKPNSSSYHVVSPDAIEPSLMGGETILRYKENALSAAVAYRGEYRTLIFGFPLESIEKEKRREKLFKEIIHFFNR